MYQLNHNDEQQAKSTWNTDFFHELMEEKRIFSTAEAKKIREDLNGIGALPNFSNHYEWATLCISYALIKKHGQDLEKLKATPNSKGYEVPSFKTCFQKQSHLWLAILSENLFNLYPNKQVSKDDLYQHITQLWHVGASELWAFWEKCKQFRESDLDARKEFAGELVKLAHDNVQSSQVSNMDKQFANPIQQQKWLDQLQNALNEINAPVNSIAEQSSGVRYDFYRVRLEKFFDFDKKYKEICSSLGITQNQLIIQPVIGESHCVDFKLLRNEQSWQTFAQDEFAETLVRFGNPNQYELPICVGIDEQGNAIFKDLATAPHLFVAGETGGGKSVCMRAIVKSLFALSSDKVEVAILDPKQVDYQVFANEPALHDNKIITEIHKIEKFLAEAVAIMNTRYGKMQENNTHKWSEYRKYHNQPYRVIVIDEVADLLGTSQTAQDNVVKLAQKARAAGIHLILSTQTPNSEIFSQALRANITARIAMRTSTAKQSEVILDEVGAERLFGKGDHLIKWGGEMQFAHSYNI